MSAITGIPAIDDRLADLPPGTMGRRFAYAGLLMVGLLMTAYASYMFTLIPIIPLKFFPDARLLALLLSGGFLGLWMMGGGAKRRALALHGVIGYVLLFHLEEATVHWIGPVPGSITGTRVGLIGTAGSILMLAAVVLMHVEVESVKLARDVKRRGADERAADALAGGLAAEGRRQVWGLAAAIGALGLFIFVAEKIFGDSATGGSYTLLVGGGLLLALALYLMRMLPGAGARSGGGR